MPAARSRIEKTELFARLRLGHDAAVTVLTPNLRLARDLARQFDTNQSRQGLSSWESADILTFGAWVERAWEDAVYSREGASVPLLLTAAQEQALWEETLRQAGAAQVLVAVAPAAAQCSDAWKLAHQWRIATRLHEAQSVDTRAFADWAARYERATREKSQTDSARLPDVIAPMLGSSAFHVPRTVALFGFDQATPQMREFIDALQARGTEIVDVAVPPHAGNPRRIELAEAKEEMEVAARWARARLEADPGARIGIVVPDLARSRAQVRRILTRTLRPDGLIAGDSATLPFDVSLGQPLADFPIVADALLVLELACGGAAYEHASRVIRSPFVVAAESELGVRARLDARLRQRCGVHVSLDALVRLCNSPNSPRAPSLVAALEALAKLRRSDLVSPMGLSQWAKSFSEVLRIAGFPGERELDSAEHQALAKWHELLAVLATVERVCGKMDCDDALRRVNQLARDTIFQPEGSDAPILVAGVLESAGLEFDHLWVMGLTDDAWPLAARPNPFVPIALQRAAGVPQADPASSLALDRRITEGWMRAADEVVFSHARTRGESELSASPLVASVPPIALEDLHVAPQASLRDAIRRAGTIETIDDSRAPPAPAGVISGGTGLFRDQAACPFRAVAKHRLGCRDAPESPRHGLDPRDRGNIVHAMLAELWRLLGGSKRLAQTDERQLETTIGAAADKAIESVKRYRPDVLSGAFGRLERARLARIAREWLALERARADFDVIAIEDKQPATFGGVTVNVKLDRMDDVPGVGRFVIDYKTGKASPSGLMLPRIDEPQLPMYALSRENVAAVAFAQVRTGEMEFRGLAKVDKVARGVEQVGRGSTHVAKAYPSWSDAMTKWKAELESLGNAFASGEARVDPKRGPATCQQCDQHPFCRIAEKSAFGAVKKAEDDD